MFGRHCLQCCREVGREAIFRQQMCERRRAIEIDHRSARSRCRWLRSSSIFITGLRAGGPRPTEIGGIIQPCRKASNSSASDSIELRVGPGGPISATTRPRSVSKTVSPPAASRTYPLSLFLRVLRPTERINKCSYQRLLCQKASWAFSVNPCSFSRLSPYGPAKTYPGTAAVLVDELDAGGLQAASDR
jgi:hypothetical protein